MKKQLLTTALLTLCLLLLTIIIKAQSEVIQWQKSLGGSDIDVAYSIRQTTDGGYIITGESYSNDGDVTGNHGWNDYWIVKLNTTGNISWQKSLGGSSYEWARSIQQSTDGCYIVAGGSRSNDGDVTGNHGTFDYWIVKIDATGNIVWQKSLGGSDWDDAMSIQQTDDGGYIVAGYSYSNDGDVTGNHSTTNTQDYWIVKLNATGNIVWQKCLGGSDSDEAFSIQQTVDGGYIVAGSSNSNDGDVTGNHGAEDYWIVKLDAAGNIVWQKSLGGSYSDGAMSIQQTADGGYIVAGGSNSNDGDVTGNHGAEDYWIVKLDATGNIVWQKCLGGSDIDFAYSIQQTNDGGYIVAGWSFSNDGDVTGNHGAADYWIAKLDTTGNIVWQNALGGSDFEIAYSIQQTADGGYIVAGFSRPNDKDITGNQGAADYWIVKLDATGNIKENVFTKSNVSVYPNIANNLITIELAGDWAQQTEASIYNIEGKGFLKPQITNSRTQVDISILPAGIYFVKVQSDKGFKVAKFIKQ